VPFTIAHPVAVIPIARRLGRYAVPSALVIGSISPDVAYFLSFGVSRPESHSLAGLFWFCLPVGFAGYLLFHLVLERPLVSLLPTGIARRLAGLLCAPRRLPAAPWSAVLGSLLIGALTHLAWDGFTHASGAGVQAVGVLHAQLFSIGRYPVFVYKLLQHTSTLMGIALLTAWVWRWLEQAPVQRLDPTPPLLPWQRATAAVVIFGLPSCAGLTSGLLALSHPITVVGLEVSVWRAVVFSISALGIAVRSFIVVWHRYCPTGSSTRGAGRPEEGMRLGSHS
jgi:Domain of unknown function (DUF4184)